MLRSILHRMGFRYRLHVAALPGKPDLVFPKYRTVVFVHGCYWHRHEGCRKSTTPTKNRDFWLDKFRENVKRDKRQQTALRQQGWAILVVWECEIESDLNRTAQQVEQALTGKMRYMPEVTASTTDSNADQF